MAGGICPQCYAGHGGARGIRRQASRAGGGISARTATASCCAASSRIQAGNSGRPAVSAAGLFGALAADWSASNSTVSRAGPSSAPPGRRQPRGPPDRAGNRAEHAGGSLVPGIMVLVTESEELPGSVMAAYERAARSGFRLACEADVGRLLAALAAAVPSGGRVLEIGTGVGVGLAWLVHGLGARRDVEVVTVELDDELQRTALSAPWPPWVRFESGDGAEVVGRLGQFDLIFPDAPGGKIFKLRRTVAALRPGGVLVVDDMDLTRHDDEQLRSALAVVRHRLLGNVDLVCAELGFGSGVIVAVKRRP